jgi:hypothetical protein
MAIRGDWDDAQGFESARSGTLYWTLSLYIDPDRVAEAAGQKGKPVTHGQFGAVQRAHLPSVMLRNAIDPLFNDIADREVQGEVQEHLIAAADAPEGDYADTPEGKRAQRKAADKAIRRHERLIFKLQKPAIQWTTEGLDYRAAPPGLGDGRAVRFRRFWLAHNNGGLSYHLSFSHHYASLAAPGDEGGYDAATYYFLSLLQKLAAPKEFELDGRHGGSASVFDTNLGIAPLDDLLVSAEDKKAANFWPFVKQQLLDDGALLFDRLAKVTGTTPMADLSDVLIDKVPFIEVPGLMVPKSRFMFLIHDERFFKRLMPVDRDGKSAARKLMVQEPCYEPYQTELARRVDRAEKSKGLVQLDAKFWQWVRLRPDYDQWIDGPHPNLRPVGGERFETLDALAEAISTNGAEWVEYRKKGGRTEVASVTPLDKIPAFEANRTDCIDYLFLAGFNQNIIDFMNQDTSEILDSIDPIYPDSSEQSDERFFVRYANHRAMISYVPKSRSLETGNDYIGTCPYAFLIHAMSLHNEFLAREHEAKSMARIERIEWHVANGEWHADKRRRRAPDPPSAATEKLNLRERLTGHDDFDKAEMAINQAKLAEYREYERFRYANPFRYDTERDVFAKLEELRGTQRKKEALALAVASLEDHASDLQRRHQADADRAAARRETQLNILLGGTGVFGAGQMIYWIGDTAVGGTSAGADAKPVTLDYLGLPGVHLTGPQIMHATETIMAYALILFVIALVYIAADIGWTWLRGTRIGGRIAARLARLRPPRS